LRSAIAELGGTLPENISPAKPIKEVKKRIKTSQPALELDPKDATGLTSSDSVE
jgi:hypothetical protein